jgi:hypothetical protein
MSVFDFSPHPESKISNYTFVWSGPSKNSLIQSTASQIFLTGFKHSVKTVDRVKDIVRAYLFKYWQVYTPLTSTTHESTVGGKGPNKSPPSQEMLLLLLLPLLLVLLLLPLLPLLVVIAVTILIFIELAIRIIGMQVFSSVRKSLFI